MSERRPPARKFSPSEMDQLEKIAHLLDTPEKITELQEIMRAHEILLDVAKKEQNWRWLKKSARDFATLFLALSAAIYGAYEVWLKFIASSIAKITGSGE